MDKLGYGQGCVVEDEVAVSWNSDVERGGFVDEKRVAIAAMDGAIGIDDVAAHGKMRKLVGSGVNGGFWAVDAVLVGEVDEDGGGDDKGVGVGDKTDDGKEKRGEKGAKGWG